MIAAADIWREIRLPGERTTLNMSSLKFLTLHLSEGTKVCLLLSYDFSYRVFPSRGQDWDHRAASCFLRPIPPFNKTSISSEPPSHIRSVRSEHVTISLDSWQHNIRKTYSYFSYYISVFFLTQISSISCQTCSSVTLLCLLSVKSQSLSQVTSGRVCDAECHLDVRRLYPDYPVISSPFRWNFQKILKWMNKK